MRGVYTMIDNMPEQEPGKDATNEEKATYKHQWEVALFYVDKFLPSTPGYDNWGNLIRPFHPWAEAGHQVDGGEKKAYVSITAEAFGLVMYENYRDSYLAKFQYVKDNSTAKKKVRKPTYSSKKPETNKFKAKWSDAHTGQGCAWHKDAFTALKDYKNHVKAFRDHDKANGDKIVQKCMDILAIEFADLQEPAKKKQKTVVEEPQEGGEVEESDDDDDLLDD